MYRELMKTAKRGATNGRAQQKNKGASKGGCGPADGGSYSLHPRRRVRGRAPASAWPRAPRVVARLFFMPSFSVRLHNSRAAPPSPLALARPHPRTRTREGPRIL